jgi:hypothetical protein
MTNYIKKLNQLSNQFVSKSIKYKETVIELSENYINNIFDLVNTNFIKQKKNNDYYFDLKILKTNKEYKFLSLDIHKNYRSEIIKTITLGKSKALQNMRSYNNTKFINDNIYSDRSYLNKINSFDKKRSQKTKSNNTKSKDIKTFKNKTITNDKQLNEFMLAIRNSLINKLSEYSYKDKKLTIDDFYNFDVSFNDSDINKKAINQ